MEEPSPPTVITPEEPVEKTFIASMADFSFKSFVTPKLVKLLYFIALVAVLYATVMWVLNAGFSGFLFRVIVSPLMFVVGVILSRAAIEIIMVLFRILELLQRSEGERRGKGDGPVKE